MKFDIKPASRLGMASAKVLGIVALRPHHPAPKACDWYLTDSIVPDDEPYMLVAIRDARSNIRGFDFYIVDYHMNCWKVKGGLASPGWQPSISFNEEIFGLKANQPVNLWVQVPQPTIYEDHMMMITAAASCFISEMNEVDC